MKQNKTKKKKNKKKKKKTNKKRIENTFKPSQLFVCML